MLPVTAAAAAAATALQLAPIMSEITLTCSDGVQMAAQVWKSQHHSIVNNSNNHILPAPAPQEFRRILCLHGWMDNCRSFYKLAPNLLTALQQVELQAQAQEQAEPQQLLLPHMNLAVPTELVALDLPGHGLSSHKSIDAPPTVLAEAAFYVAEAVRQLQWHRPQQQPDHHPSQHSFILVGHSMGAAISCLYAASFPEQVSKLVLLEGAGPMARNPKDVAKHVRQHVQRRQMALLKNNKNGLPTSGARIYPSMDKAVETRCQTARNFPGNQTLSREAALEMVQRGTRPVIPVPVTLSEEPHRSSDPLQQQQQQQQLGIQFVHDPRLQWPSLQYFTMEQTEALYEDITCPTAVVLAQQGWPFDPEKHSHMLELLQPVVHETLPGSHHFHADPDTAPAVVATVADFLLERYLQ